MKMNLLTDSVAIKVLALVLTGSLFQANASEGRDIDSLLGDISVAEGQVVRDIDSVNGDVELESNATARNVSTVNGGIRIDDNVNLTSAETVNGGIRGGRDIRVDHSLSTVNGRIILNQNSWVGEDVETVNGSIRLKQVSVGGDLKTVNGDIYVLESSDIRGDVIIKKNKVGWFDSGDDYPVIEIDADSRVEGTIHLYREAELRIHKEAKVGDVMKHYER